MLGRGEDRREATVPEAAASRAPSSSRRSPGPRALAVLASPVASNEDLLASLAFARDALGVRSVYVGGRPEGAGGPLPHDAGQEPQPARGWSGSPGRWIWR